MPSLDPRLHPYRPDLAASHLRGKVEAARFVDGTPYEVIEPVADLRRAPSHEARLDTQALLGERVIVYETTEEGWAWGQLEADHYVGWLSANALARPGPSPTHKVAALRTLAFAAPDIKTPPLCGLPLGAALAVVRQDDRFAVIAANWHIPLVHLTPIDAKERDFVAVAEKFLGTPYLWGGKTSLGLDCSGLVQIALQAAGIPCPRDTDLQEQALGARLAFSDLRRGDLIFWKGHVAIARDSDALIHANGFHMSVTIEPVADAIARIKAAGSEITSVRRLG
jgi:hypothetical protein